VSKELHQKYEALHAAVKKIIVKWDPIGVLQSEDWPDDEYDSYIPAICSILMNSSDIATLISKLDVIVELNMGLGSQHARNKEFAEQLWKLREQLESALKA